MKPAIPRTVWLLSLVGMFMDIAFAMIHGRLPEFILPPPRERAWLKGVAEPTARAGRPLRETEAACRPRPRLGR